MKDFVRKITIVGGLVDCRVRDFAEALKEVGSGLVVSTSPIWLFVVVQLFAKDGGSFSAIIDQVLTEGVLTIYAATTLAPILYTVIIDKGKSYQSFPSPIPFMLATVIVWMISVSVLVLGDPNFGAKFEFDPNKMPMLSIVMFSLAVCLLYLTVVYRNQRLDPANMMAQQTHDFVNDFIKGDGK